VTEKPTEKCPNCGATDPRAGDLACEHPFHLLARELLLHLLEHTEDSVIDEVWPDNSLTLDDIAGLILARHDNERTE
jgi:hypothetical protein